MRRRVVIGTFLWVRHHPRVVLVVIGAVAGLFLLSWLIAPALAVYCMWGYVFVLEALVVVVAARHSGCSQPKSLAVAGTSKVLPLLLRLPPS